MTDEPNAVIDMMNDDQIVLMKSCLILCARRLRHYENEHLILASGGKVSSLVDRQQAEDQAEIDCTLADMAENLVRQAVRAEDAYIVAREAMPG